MWLDSSIIPRLVASQNSSSSSLCGFICSELSLKSPFNIEISRVRFWFNRSLRLAQYTFSELRVTFVGGSSGFGILLRHLLSFLILLFKANAFDIMGHLLNTFKSPSINKSKLSYSPS